MQRVSLRLALLFPLLVGALTEVHARYYDARTGRFLSVDPHANKYAAWSPYAYTLDNPLRYVDPDGTDAIPVVFKDYKAQVGPVRLPTGHAGVLLIDNKTGYTRYYEYGRYDRAGIGEVRTRQVPNVVIDKSTGQPTAQSLSKVFESISKQAGKGGDISGAYIKNDDFDKMNDYAKSKLEENKNPNREPYDLIDNNCATFTHGVLGAGGVETESKAIPSSYIDGVRQDHPDLDYKAKTKELKIEEEKKR